MKSLWSKAYWQQLEERPLYLVLFLLFFLVRIFFKWVSGYNNFELFLDSERYDEYSNNILQGHFNMDHTAFILAPLYPYFLAAIKFLFGANWQFFGVLFQFLLVSLSGVYLYKIAILLFQKRRIALVGALFYCFFPMTLWYNFTFTQETLFQSLFIFAIYHLLQTLYGNPKYLVPSALFYSLAFLTKSHLLLFSPFVVLLFFTSSPYSLFQKIKYSILYGAICLAFTLPYGLYNLKVNGVYALSSYGTGAFFHISNSEYTYNEVFHPAALDSEAHRYGTYLIFAFDKNFEYPKYGKVNSLPMKERQRMHAILAWEWIWENPRDFWRLKWFSFYRFFTPGLSGGHHSMGVWLASFLSSLPIYLLAYVGIFQSMRRDWRKHWWIVLLMGTILVFFVVFSPVSRFRTVTLEPYYLIYAAFALSQIWSKAVSAFQTVLSSVHRA